MEVNQALFLWLNGLVGLNPFLDLTVLFAARYFIFIFGLGFVAFIFNQPDTKRPRLLLMTVLCGVLALQIVILINAIYPVARPQTTDLPVKMLIEYGGQQSFPSQHTILAFLLAGLILSRQKRLGIAYFSGATIIGLARIIAGVHWPLDVLAGALIGISLSYLGALLLYE